MTSVEIGILGIIVLLVLIMLRIPVGLAMIMVSVLGYIMLSSLGPALAKVGSDLILITENYGLSVIPLFVVMGLFITAGMARAFIPNMLTGFSIAYTTWSGYVAGEAVARKVKTMDLPEIDLQQILLKKEKFLQPLSRKGSITPDDVVEKLQKVIFPANVLILVKEENLQAALQEVKKISAELAPQMTAPDLHELIKARETETMLVAAELTLRASMLRKESRPAIFYRQDYAQRDDANWLKWIMIRKTGDGIDYSTLPIES